MTSHPLEALGECKLMKLSIGALELPSTKMQEQAQALIHIDLVLSQLLMNVLKVLNISVMKEIHLGAELTVT